MLGFFSIGFFHSSFLIHLYIPGMMQQPDESTLDTNLSFVARKMWAFEGGWRHINVTVRSSSAIDCLGSSSIPRWWLFITTSASAVVSRLRPLGTARHEQWHSIENCWLLLRNRYKQMHILKSFLFFFSFIPWKLCEVKCTMEIAWCVIYNKTWGSKLPSLSYLGVFFITLGYICCVALVRRMSDKLSPPTNSQPQICLTDR